MNPLNLISALEELGFVGTTGLLHARVQGLITSHELSVCTKYPRAALRCGKALTKGQYLESKAYLKGYQGWPKTVGSLAEALYRGEGCDFALHDALLDSGLPALAEHFAGAKEHPGCRAGPGQCRVIKLLIGKLTPRQQLLGTPDASMWLKISSARFRRLARKENLDPERECYNGANSFLWSPETVLELDQRVRRSKPRR